MAVQRETIEWLKTVSKGDLVVYQATIDAWDLKYFEDIVIANNWPIIRTKNGLIFTNGICFANGMLLKMENPSDDYFGSGKNQFYLECTGKENPNISLFMSQESLTINKALRSIIGKENKQMNRYEYRIAIQDALIEDKYHNGDSVDYYSTLPIVVGAQVDGGKLTIGGDVFATRATKKVGYYKIYKKSIDADRDDIYVVNTKTREVRKDVSNSFFCTWHWLEQEIISHIGGQSDMFVHRESESYKNKEREMVFPEGSGFVVNMNGDTNSNIYEGTVDWFNKKDGFGFINLNNGTRAFIYYKNILIDGWPMLNSGEIVECRVRHIGVVQEAIDVRVIE